MPGCEAAVALARLGHNVLLITGNLDRLGYLSCNPAIGGLAKGTWYAKSTPWGA